MPAIMSGRVPLGLGDILLLAEGGIACVLLA